LSDSLTYGLTHVALVVKDVDASIAFYNAVFGVKVMYRNPGFGQVQTIGSNDIIVFEENPDKQKLIGNSGGVLHLGFRLRAVGDLEKIVERILKAGGTIIDKGEFCPGEPYVFFKDPDGYELEVWYELM
jgi:catechol 2,3-dioxygenase-like lactoylglutathione lyase family enzyme